MLDRRVLEGTVDPPTYINNLSITRGSFPTNRVVDYHRLYVDGFKIEYCTITNTVDIDVIVDEFKKELMGMWNA